MRCFKSFLSQEQNTCIWAAAFYDHKIRLLFSEHMLLTICDTTLRYIVTIANTNIPIERRHIYLFWRIYSIFTKSWGVSSVRLKYNTKVSAFLATHATLIIYLYKTTKQTNVLITQTHPRSDQVHVHVAVRDRAVTVRPSTTPPNRVDPSFLCSSGEPRLRCRIYITA